MTSRPGVLVAQMGTPDAPTPPAVRRYLREFLGDLRVIEVNRLVWWVVLNAVVLPARSARSARLYRRVWTPDGSPLLANSSAQVKGLQAALGESVAVELGMRYGSPSLASGLDALRARGVDRVLVFPMFPQYSGTTTGSLYDGVFACLKRQRVLPSLRIVPPYYEHSAYIGALAHVFGKAIRGLAAPPDLTLLSFHGLPRAYADRGDVYPSHCAATARALAGALGLSSSQHRVCFQSRFGREEWLTPYTDALLQSLPASGVRRVVVSCPGFVADCLETLDEIGREARQKFIDAGGEQFSLVPCLNANRVWIDAMATIAREELAGWT